MGLCFLLIGSGVFAKQKTPVQNGLLDLRNRNWQKDGIVNLTGNWEFYWHKFYSPQFLNNTSIVKQYAYVPSFWNNYIDEQENSNGFGYATYHVVVLCPPSNEQLALKFLTVESAYKLFVNGKEVLRVGNADTTAANTVPEFKPAIVNVTPENNKLDIVVQVSNFHNKIGGVWDVVKLGTREQIHSKLIVNLALEFLVAGGLFISFVYYLILFASFKKQYVLLFFSLVCWLVSIRSLVTGEMPMLYISNAGWEFARRMEYISLYLSVPLFSIFSYHLFPKDFSRKALYIIVPVCAAFAALSLFAPYFIYTYPVRYYEKVMLIIALYGLFVYIKAARNKRPGSILFLTGFCIFLVTVINDILYINLVIHTVPLFYVGLLSFVVTLSILFSSQFAKTFSELQVANKKLSAANDELELKNNEIQEKNNELKKINHELDSFVNRTSHDLRSPLNSVTGIVKVALEEKNVETIKGYLAVQEKTLDRMKWLINDIIDFSKNKRLQLTLREVNFEKLVHDALEDHSFMSNAQKVKKNIDIKQYEKFISDPRRVSVVINNLVSNAIKYADITKEQPEITINILVADSMASIEVADNGIGIEEQHLDKIFTLFYRATSSATGSGLGLYIIKETVEKLGGYVNLHSQKGEGSTIKINIPDMGHKL